MGMGEFLVIAWLGFSFVVGRLAKSRGRDFRNWTLISFLISPILTFIILFLIPNLAAIERESQQREQAEAHTKWNALEQSRNVKGAEIALRIEKLRLAHDKNLLTDEEYSGRKKNIIDALQDKQLIETGEDFLGLLIPLIDNGALTADEASRLKDFAFRKMAAPTQEPIEKPSSSRPAVTPQDSEALNSRPCPRCGGPIHPQATTCMHCWAKVSAVPKTASIVSSPTDASIKRPPNPLEVRRPNAVAVLLFCVPSILIVVHIIIFQVTAGVEPLIALLVIGAGGAIAIRFLPGTAGVASSEFFKLLSRQKIWLYIAAGAVIAAEVAAVFLALKVTRWRRDFDVLLENQDPCAVKTVTDTEYATQEQLRRLSRRDDECLQQIKHNKCMDAAKSLEEGKPTDNYLEILGNFGDIAGRIIGRRLVPADLSGVGKQQMPCLGFPDVSGLFWLTYVRQISQTPSAWAEVKQSGDIHSDLAQTLSSRVVALSSETDSVLNRQVNQIASAIAASKKKSEDMSSARELCELQKSIGATESDACVYLEARHRALSKAEKAAEEAQQRREEAKQRREEAAEEAQAQREEAAEEAKRRRFDACTDRCARLPEGSSAAEACDDRCLGFDKDIF
jgi:hypothetical protein